MKAKQFLFAATHPAGVAPPVEPVKVNDQLMRQLKARAAQLPVEGELPSFAGSTAWLNSEPLTAADLRGKVVLVDFWTYTCVNWPADASLRSCVGSEVHGQRAGGDRRPHSRISI
jgi:hypothetical protein